MLKKTITYTDYNGETRTEDFYFNFTKAELTQLQFGTIGGLDALLQRIVAEKKVPELVEMFQMLILKAYGKKSDDGRRFIKSETLREEFSQTEAYSELWMELITDEKAAAAFVNGLMPADVVSKINTAAIAEKPNLTLSNNT